MRVFGMAALALVWACGTAAAAPLKVVTTTTILADFVHQIAGDDVEISVLVGPDRDAHVYEPSAADLARLKVADMLVMNGLQLEGWMTRTVQTSGFQGQTLIAARDVNPRKAEVDGAKISDPHAWLDVTQARAYVVAIDRALVTMDPPHADQYRQRAAAYDRQLSGLNRWVKEQIAQVPESKRKFITNHDAFAYFANAYDVTVFAANGLSTQATLSGEEQAALIAKIKASGSKALFAENITDRKNIDWLSTETGIAVVGTLYTDALSPPNGPAPTFEAMIRYDVERIRDAMLKN